MYNDYISSKCEEQNIPFIDITEISRMLADSPEQLLLIIFILVAANIQHGQKR